MQQQYSFRNDYVDIFIKDNILWVIYTNNVRITEDKARIIVNERLKVANGRSYLTLNDCGTGQSVDKKSREIFGSDDAKKYVTAGAIVLRNITQRMFVNSYFWFANLDIPYAAFSSEEKALKWLAKYR